MLGHLRNFLTEYLNKRCDLKVDFKYTSVENMLILKTIIKTEHRTIALPFSLTKKKIKYILHLSLASLPTITSSPLFNYTFKIYTAKGKSNNFKLCIATYIYAIIDIMQP